MALSLTEEQTKLMRLCIKHSDPIKPDWEKVAKEAGLVSQSAASQRWARLYKLIIGGDKGTPAAKGKANTTRTPANATRTPASITKARAKITTPQTTSQKAPQTNGNGIKAENGSADESVGEDVAEVPEEAQTPSKKRPLDNDLGDDEDRRANKVKREQDLDS